MPQPPRVLLPRSHQSPWHFCFGTNPPLSNRYSSLLPSFLQLLNTYLPLNCNSRITSLEKSFLTIWDHSLTYFHSIEGLLKPWCLLNSMYLLTTFSPPLAYEPLMAGGMLPFLNAQGLKQCLLPSKCSVIFVKFGMNGWNA